MPTTLIGWNLRSELVVDARIAPVHFLHEDVRVQAVDRFKLADGKDYILPIGYRAIVNYDENDARNKIVQVIPIPEDVAP